MCEKVRFKKIDENTLGSIINLSFTLYETQKKMVADNAVSIAQAHFSDCAWFRGIYLDDEPIGFIMTANTNEKYKGEDLPGSYLWRFMITSKYQRKGYGTKAIKLLEDELKKLGVKEILASCVISDDSAEKFYLSTGFISTGTINGKELLYKKELV